MDTDTRAPTTTETFEALPERLRTHITEALLPGEQVVWVGQALERRVRFNARWRVVGGLLLLAVCGWLAQSLIRLLIKQVGQILHGTDSMLSANELGSLLISLYFLGMFGWFSLHALELLMSPRTMLEEARHSACIVTNQRALIVSAKGRRLVMSTQAFMPEQLQNAFVLQGADTRCANIVLRREWLDSDEGEYAKDTGFLFLADVAPAVQALRAIGAEVDDSGRPRARHSSAEVRSAAHAPAEG